MKLPDHGPQLLQSPEDDSLVWVITGETWIRPDTVTTQTKAYLEPSLEKAGVKLNIQKTKIMAFSPMTS